MILLTLSIILWFSFVICFYFWYNYRTSDLKQVLIYLGILVILNSLNYIKLTIFDAKSTLLNLLTLFKSVLGFIIVYKIFIISKRNLG